MGANPGFALGGLSPGICSTGNGSHRPLDMTGLAHPKPVHVSEFLPKTMRESTPPVMNFDLNLNKTTPSSRKEHSENDDVPKNGARNSKSDENASIPEPSQITTESS